MDDFDQTQAIFLEDLDEEDATDELDPEEEKKPVATLKVLFQKGLNETSHQLYEGDNVVGRSADTCHVCIPSKSLSKEHACIQITGDSHLIYDKGSRNKTRRGKLFLTPEVRYELKSGDEIMFADVKCTYSKIEEELRDDGAAMDTDDSESFLLQAESTLEISAEDNKRKEENNNANKSVKADSENNDSNDDDDIFVQATQPFTKDLDKMPDIVIQESPIVKASASDGEVTTLVFSESESEPEVAETPKKRGKKSEKSRIEETQFLDESDPDASSDFTKFAQATQAYDLGNQKKDTSGLLGAATQAYGDLDSEDDNEDNVKIADASEEATQSFVEPEPNHGVQNKTKDEKVKKNANLDTQSFDDNVNSEGDTQSFDLEEKSKAVDKKGSAGDVKETQVFEEDDLDENSGNGEFQELFAMNTMAPVLDSEDEESGDEDNRGGGDNSRKEEKAKEKEHSKMEEESTQVFDEAGAEPATLALNESKQMKAVMNKTSAVKAMNNLGTKEKDLPTQVFDPTLPAEKISNQSTSHKAPEEASTQVFDDEHVDNDSDLISEKKSKEDNTSTQDLPTQVFDATVAVPDTIAISENNAEAVSDTIAVSDTVAVSDTIAVCETLAVSELESNKSNSDKNRKDQEKSSKSRHSPSKKNNFSKQESKDIGEAMDTDEETDEEKEDNERTREEVGRETETQAYGMDTEIETQAYGMDDSDEDGEEDGGSSNALVAREAATQAYGVGMEDATQAYGMDLEDEEEEEEEEALLQQETQAFDELDVSTGVKNKNPVNDTKDRDANQAPCVNSEDEDDSDVEEMSLLKHKGDEEPTQVFEMEVEEPQTSAPEPTLQYNLETDDGLEEPSADSKTTLGGVPVTNSIKTTQDSGKAEGVVSASSSALSVEIPNQDSESNPWVGESQYSPELGDIGKDVKFVSCLDVDTQGDLPDSLESSDEEQQTRPPLIPLPSRSPLKPALAQGKKARSPSVSPKRVAFTEEVEEPKSSKRARASTAKVTAASSKTDLESEKNLNNAKGKRGKRSAVSFASDKEETNDVNDASNSGTVSKTPAEGAVDKGKGNKGDIKGKASLAKTEEVKRSSSGRRISRSSLLKDFETSSTTSKKGKKTAAENSKKTTKEEKKITKEKENNLSRDLDGEQIPDIREESDETKIEEIPDKDSGNLSDLGGEKQRGRRGNSAKVQEVESGVSDKSVESENKKIDSEDSKPVSGKRKRGDDKEEVVESLPLSKKEKKETEVSTPEETKTVVGRGRRRATNQEVEQEEKKTESEPKPAQGKRSRWNQKEEEVEFAPLPEEEEKGTETSAVEETKIVERRGGRRDGKQAAELEDKKTDSEAASGRRSRRNDKEGEMKPSSLSKEEEKGTETSAPEKTKTVARRGGRSAGNLEAEETGSVTGDDSSVDSSKTTRRGKRKADTEVEAEMKTTGKKSKIVDDSDKEKDETMKAVDEVESKEPVGRKGRKSKAVEQIQATTSRRGRRVTNIDGKKEMEQVEEVEDKENDLKEEVVKENIRTSSKRLKKDDKDADAESKNEKVDENTEVPQEDDSDSSKPSRKGRSGKADKVENSKRASGVKNAGEKPMPPPESAEEKKTNPRATNKRGKNTVENDKPEVKDQATPSKPKQEEETKSTPAGNKRKRGKVSTDSQQSSQDAPPSAKKARAETPTPSTPSTPSQRGKLPSSQPLSSPSLRKSTTDHKPKVMFTGVIDQKGEKILKDLGGEIAANIQQCTHLVTDKVRRTVKFLGGLAKGLPIVTPLWLENCKTAGTFLDGHPFLVSDPAVEKQFSFNLTASITKAQTNGPIFGGYKIHVTKSVKPDPAQMKDILLCAGAEFLPKMPTKAGENVMVVSCAEDEKLCKPATNAKIPVTTAEFVLTGILRQEVDLSAHALFNKDQQTAPKARSKKR